MTEYNCGRCRGLEPPEESPTLIEIEFALGLTEASLDGLDDDDIIDPEPIAASIRARYGPLAAGIDELVTAYREGGGISVRFARVATGAK